MNKYMQIQHKCTYNVADLTSPSPFDNTDQQTLTWPTSCSIIQNTTHTIWHR